MPVPFDSGRSSGRRRTDHPSGGSRRRANSRRAQRRRHRFLPSPAVAGAAALMVAGVGAVVVSSGATGSSPAAAHAPVRPLAVSTDTGTSTDAEAPAATRPGARNDAGTGNGRSTGTTSGATTAAAAYTAGGDVGWPPGTGGTVQQVSRGVDRATLQQQAELQSRQRMQALAELASKVQARARELASDQWVLPLTGYTLSASFGETSYLWATVHTGQDLSAPEGTAISSIAQGTVTSVKYDGAYGNKTVVTLDDGTEIWYCHQSSQQVHVGDRVAPGERIGAVGSTGNTTGPHLHLEVRPDGKDPVDPLQALIQHGVNL